MTPPYQTQIGPRLGEMPNPNDLVEHGLPSQTTPDQSTQARLPGVIVVCSVGFGSVVSVSKCEASGAPISVEELPWHRAPQPKSESSASRIFCHSDITVAFKAKFEVFTRVGPDNSLERLTERSVGRVTDRRSNVYEFLVTLL